MKRITLSMAIMLFMVNTLSVLAAEQSVAEKPSEAVMSDPGTITAANPGTPRPMPEMRMMHKGKGQHEKGQSGMKHGGGQHGKGQHGKHDQVVKRLDMIEARLAKIEAMLEILIRR